jgi:hypothetical protein
LFSPQQLPRITAGLLGLLFANFEVSEKARPIAVPLEERLNLNLHVPVLPDGFIPVTSKDTLLLFGSPPVILQL